MVVLLPLSARAADETDTSLSDSTSADATMTTSKNDVFMIRQQQPIAGFEPLTVAGQQVDAAFLEETLGEPHGAIVLLHDQGEALESWGVVTPLRHEMLQYGWSTLSLMLDYPFTPNILLAIKPDVPVVNDSDQTTAVKEPLPTVDSDATKTDNTQKDEPASLPAISNQQRIEAAVAFLSAKGIKRIIFLGHGKGGVVAIDALGSLTSPISALILVGTDTLDNNDVFQTFNQPILDIYGDQDLDGVSLAVNTRKVLMKRNGNIRYTSREIIGANHVFYGLESTLASTVRGWLHATFVNRKQVNNAALL